MQERRQGYDQVVAHMATTNQALININDTLIELKEAKKVQNGRIGKLEQKSAWVNGGLAVIAFIVTLLGVVVVWAKR